MDQTKVCICVKHIKVSYKKNNETYLAIKQIGVTHDLIEKQTNEPVNPWSNEGSQGPWVNKRDQIDE